MNDSKVIPGLTAFGINAVSQLVSKFHLSFCLVCAYMPQGRRTPTARSPDRHRSNSKDQHEGGVKNISMHHSVRLQLAGVCWQARGL